MFTRATPTPTPTPSYRIVIPSFLRVLSLPIPIPIPSHTKSPCHFPSLSHPSWGFFSFPFFLFPFSNFMGMVLFRIVRAPSTQHCYLLGGRYLFGQVLSCLHMCMMMYFFILFFLLCLKVQDSLRAFYPCFHQSYRTSFHTGNIANLFWVSPPPDHDGGCTVETR